MKILYYSPHPQLHLHSTAGYGTHMREMIGAFRELGHEVLPLIMGGIEPSEIPAGGELPGGMKRFVKGVIPPVVWETLKDWRLLQYDRKQAALALRRAVQSFQPDLIYERANYLQCSGVEVARAMRVPHILEVNSPYVEETVVLKGRSWYLEQAERAEIQQMQQTGRVAVVSSVLRNYLAERTGVEPDKFLITPNAIDPTKLTVDEQQVASLKNKYGLTSSTVFGFVGSIFPWHGVDLLIKAFAEVQPQWPETHLLIVGDGEILSQLQSLARNLGIDQAVTFVGRVAHEEVFPHLACMDICVLANSHWYGSPIKLFEYGAMGKAIIAPDNGPVNEVMKHESEGLLVPPQTADLAAAMQQYLHQSAWRRDMALTFQQKVLTEHTWKKTAERITEIAESLKQEISQPIGPRSSGPSFNQKSI